MASNSNSIYNTSYDHYRKFHSWQCIKLTIPSSCLNSTIGESINILCLKIVNGGFDIIHLNGPLKDHNEIDSHLEIWNGLQSVRWPFIHATKNIKTIIFQSMVSIWYLVLWSTRWDRLVWQVQTMTNQTVSQ